MSLNNDYTVQLLVADRQQSLLAEAAEARLAREVREGRPSWWRRLTHAENTVRAARPAVRLRVRHSTGH